MLPLRDHLSTRSPAGVNYAIIAVNVAVSALVLAGVIGGQDASATTPPPGAFVPGQIVAHPLASLPTLFTYMFLHATLAHLGGNMLFLWIFGDNVEDTLGHARYAALYLACGVAAALGQVAAGPHSTVPMVGASGAISGVLAGYLLLYPRSPITVVNPIPLMWLFWGFTMWLPAWFVIVEWFAANLWSAFHPERGGAGGVAFVAHITGFVVGLVLLPLLRKHEPVAYERWDRLLRPRRA
jgi:membrane associated rhomboid family serine protease